MVVERALGEPDVGDDALVRVVVAVEDERAQRASPGRAGGGTRRTIASRISCTPVPSFALARRTSSRGMARVSSSSSMTISGSALGRSILLMTGMTVRLCAMARWTLASVCASMPWVASTTRIAPSQAWASG